MNQQSLSPVSKAGALPLIGGVLALDFCNTASGRGTGGTIEHLLTPWNLLEWCSHAGILDEVASARLRAVCADDAFGCALLQRAIGLRDAIYRLVVALATRLVPDQSDMDVIAAEQVACLAAGRLTAKDGGFGWTWRVQNAPAAVVLGPIVASALALMTQADCARLKQCAGHQCGWLFIDTTKSNNRRWCEMVVCGNRAKQKRRQRRALDS